MLRSPVDEAELKVVDDTISENPYTRYQFVSQNSVVETDRAKRYARMIALLVARKLSREGDSRG